MKKYLALASLLFACHSTLPTPPGKAPVTEPAKPPAAQVQLVQPLCVASVDEMIFPKYFTDEVAAEFGEKVCDGNMDEECFNRYIKNFLEGVKQTYPKGDSEKAAQAFMDCMSDDPELTCFQKLEQVMLETNNQNCVR